MDMCGEICFTWRSERYPRSSAVRKTVVTSVAGPWHSSCTRESTACTGQSQRANIAVIKLYRVVVLRGILLESINCHNLLPCPFVSVFIRSLFSLKSYILRYSLVHDHKLIGDGEWGMSVYFSEYSSLLSLPLLRVRYSPTSGLTNPIAVPSPSSPSPQIVSNPLTDTY